MNASQGDFEFSRPLIDNQGFHLTDPKVSEQS